MKGKAQKLNSLEEIFNHIKNTNDGTFLIGHWSKGLLLKDREEGIKILQDSENYEKNIPFIFFNEEYEIIWNNYFGWYLEIGNEGDFEVEEKTIYLNTDTGKFPGIKALIDETKACVDIFKKSGKVYFIKIKRLGGN